MKCLKSCSLLFILVFLLAAANSQAAEVYPDNFDGPGIHESFQWQNEPDNWSIVNGWLHIEGTFGGNLWCSDEATRVYQEIGDEDFEIETHMKYAWTDDAVAGLVVKSPSSDNWVMLKLWTHPDLSAQLQFQKKCDEGSQGLTGEAPGYRPTGGEAEIWLKLKREGSECTGFYKTSEADEWTQTGVTPFPFEAPYQVGLFGWNHILDFDYFRDNTSPFQAAAVSPKTKLATTWGNIKH